MDLLFVLSYFLHFCLVESSEAEVLLRYFQQPRILLHESNRAILAVGIPHTVLQLEHSLFLMMVDAIQAIFLHSP